jgi:iron complex transport system ATP-binding protein
LVHKMTWWRHDLNLARRHAGRIVAMQSGKIAAEGLPQEVITPGLIAQVFGVECRIADDPVSGSPMVVPIGKHRGKYLPVGP